MSCTTWFAFLMSACFAAISPGAGAILIISHALIYGWRNTSFVIIGQEIALIIVVFSVGIGAGILLSSSKILLMIKILGAVWLVYMGYIKWSAPIEINNILTSSALVTTGRKRFISGFLTNLTNVKAIVFLMATMPQFINPMRSLWLQVVLMTITIVTVDMVVMYVYAYTASRMQCYFREPKILKKQNQFFGSLLILIACSLFFLH